MADFSSISTIFNFHDYTSKKNEPEVIQSWSEVTVKCEESLETSSFSSFGENAENSLEYDPMGDFTIQSVTQDVGLEDLLTDVVIKTEPESAELSSDSSNGGSGSLSISSQEVDLCPCGFKTFPHNNTTRSNQQRRISNWKKEKRQSPSKHKIKTCGISINDSDYRNKRDKNNESSRRSRQIHKVKMQLLRLELTELEEKNRLLIEKERLLHKVVKEIFSVAVQFLKAF